MKKLFTMELYGGEDIALENTCDGEVLLSVGSTGDFHGERMNGKVLPGGMGITTTPRDGVNDLSSDFILVTDDNEKLLLSVKAFLNIGSEKEDILIKGGKVNPSEYYYKGVATFRTGSDRYKDLERKVCICEGIIEKWDKVIFEIFLV